MTTHMKASPLDADSHIKKLAVAMSPKQRAVMRAEIDKLNGQDRFLSILMSSRQAQISKCIEAQKAAQLASGFFPCPRCRETSEITKQGQRRGHPLFRCKSCGRYYTPLSGTMLDNLHLSDKIIYDFIYEIARGTVLSELCRLIGIRPRTANELLHVVFYAIGVVLDENPIRLSGTIQVDETYYPIGFQGNRKSDDLEINRPPHRRAKDDSRGTKGYQTKACIVCAIDEKGNSIAQFCGVGSPTAKTLITVLRRAIDAKESTTLISDGALAYRPVGKALHIDSVQKSTFCNSKDNVRKRYHDYTAVNRVNSYHAKVKAYLARRKGVSAVYLQGYLDVFVWMDNHPLQYNEFCNQVLQVLLNPQYFLTKEELQQKFLAQVKSIIQNKSKHK